MIQLKNECMDVHICESTGSILQLTDINKSVSFLNTVSPCPFKVDFGDGLICSYTHFSYAWLTDFSLELKWELREGLLLTSVMQLDRDELSFRSGIKNMAVDNVPYVVSYPVIRGISRLHSKDGDYLFHPYATGALVQNPLEVFTADNPGFLSMPYPECYSGCSMQFLSYYAAETAGLYLAAYDPSGHVKWLNFYKEQDTLTFEHMYGYQSAASAAAEWPFVIKLMSGHPDWYEAAEEYRDWTVRQPWCKDTLNSLADDQKPKWLLEEVGVCTFGINAGFDRTLWLAHYKESLNTAIFHITGPDWTSARQDYRNNLCGGYNDWFPTGFSKANLETIRSQNDYFAPFEFDFFANLQGADSESLVNALMVNPEHKYSRDSYPFTILCPCEEYTQKLHISRDLQMQKESGCNALYYDISANNLLHACINPAHRHASGGSPAITDGFRETFQKTKAAVSRQAGTYIPAGTELINEVFLPQLDYYQARAWAQPCSGLETLYFRDFIKSGSMRIVPAFTYVYHEYGAIRLDGYGKLTEEIGELYFHTVAKTYLWGGIYELNYEWSPMEVIQGRENPPEEHYFTFDPQGYEFSPDRAAYLSQYAHFRTGNANKYLAYGKMHRPLSMGSIRQDFSYFHYNMPQNSPEYQDCGIISEEGILNSVWEYSGTDGTNIGICIANTTNRQQHIRFQLPEELQNYNNKILYYNYGQNTHPSAENLSGREPDITLTLSPRKVYLLELTN